MQTLNHLMLILYRINKNYKACEKTGEKVVNKNRHITMIDFGLSRQIL